MCPFLLSAVLVVIGLVVRVHMEETPIFRMAQERNEVVKAPVVEVFRKSWVQVLQATFLVAVTYTLFYTLATWSLAWGTKPVGQGGGGLGFTNQEYLLMLMVAVCVFALFIVLSLRVCRPDRPAPRADVLVGGARRVRGGVPLPADG